MNALSSYALVTVCLLGQVPADPVESLGNGVLVTDSGRMYEGKLDRVGKLYRVMSGGRSEMVRDVNVIFTGSSKDDAYEFLKSKKKPDVAEEAARMADWCKRYGMPKEAVAEARMAVKLAPDDRAIAKLLRDCEEYAKSNRPVIRVVGSAANKPTPSEGTITAPKVEMPVMTASLPVKVVPTKAAEIEASFAKFVQPVLMNQCANCHADPMRNVAFRFTRIPQGILVSPHTMENAAAAMTQIRKDQPHTSPLLTFAISPHGGKATAPLLRTSTAYKNLESWIATAAAAMPAEPIVQAKSTVVVSSPVAVTPQPRPDEPQPLPTLPVTPPVPKPVPVKGVDPFDPAEFNKVIKKP